MISIAGKPALWSARYCARAQGAMALSRRSGQQRYLGTARDALSLLRPRPRTWRESLLPGHFSIQSNRLQTPWPHVPDLGLQPFSQPRS